MPTTSRTYESKLHLGLMAIIIVLLLLCAGSNFVVYRQRVAERVRVERTLREQTLAAAELLHIRTEGQPPVDQVERVRRQLGLTTLSVMPCRIVVGEEGGIAVAPENSLEMPIAPGGIGNAPILSEKLGEVQSGDAGDYLMLMELGMPDRHVLLAVGNTFPEFQLISQASDVLFYASLAGLIVLGILYVTVTRVLIAPFERLKRNAQRAGRTDGKNSDIDAIISDYEQLVSELRKSEGELLDLSRLYQQKAESLEHFSNFLLKSMVSGVMTLNQTGTIVSMNRSMVGILALDNDDWEGRNVAQLPSYCNPIVTAIFASNADRPGSILRECELHISQDSTRIVGVTSSRVNNAEGNQLGYSVLIHDLSEVDRLRRELQKKEQLAALGEMAGGLAHQLRNALGSARGYARLAEKKYNAHANPQDSMNRLTDELVQTEQLVSRFLDFARPLKLESETVYVSELVSGIVKNFEVREDCHTHRFMVSCTGSPAVIGDSLLLRQALTNVIENAVKAYESGQGEIRVAVREMKRAVIIEVADSGAGIEPQHLEEIFFPFFTTRVDGTGLGLPLAKKFIDLHNGQLDIRSGVGDGTTVTITLPTITEPVAV